MASTVPLQALKPTIKSLGNGPIQNPSRDRPFEQLCLAVDTGFDKKLETLSTNFLLTGNGRSPHVESGRVPCEANTDCKAQEKSLYSILLNNCTSPNFNRDLEAAPFGGREQSDALAFLKHLSAQVKLRGPRTHVATCEQASYLRHLCLGYVVIQLFHDSAQNVRFRHLV